ncbi:AAA family ATPase [Geodermatophilus amargosae]|uniref:AAA family ATPase n=1 Tax=Geodermatophilus amargosae TaxID=1296565 RepID=UPI0034DF3F01
MVVVGLQGAGTSTWVQRHPVATHAVVSTDHRPRARRREARQRRVVAELPAAWRSVVVDDSSPSPEERAPLVAAARAAGLPVRAVWVDTPREECLARVETRNAAREERARVPLVGVPAARERFRPPSEDEGFDRVDVVRPGSRAAERRVRPGGPVR